MLGTIRRHQHWLWVIIVTLTIASFLFFFSPYSKLSGPSRGKVDLGTVNDQPISRESYQAAQRDIYLRYLVTHGDWPDHDAEAKRLGFNANRETYNQLLLISKMKDLNIQVSSTSVARLAAQILGAAPYETFMEKRLKPEGFRGIDFESFLRHELGIQQLIAVQGLSGKLITPQEAETLYRRERQELATEAVFFTGSNYLASVVVTPESVGQFYTNQMSRYRLPDRVQVRYVQFELTNFFAEAGQEMAKMTNLDALVEHVYEDRGTNYYRDAKSPAEVREKIKTDMRRELAQRNARKMAAAFAIELSEQSPQRAENLGPLAARSNLTVKVTAPFDLQDGPEELRVPASFSRAAFALTEQEPFAPAIVGEDAVYLIAFQKRFPSEIQSLASILAQVTADYRFTQAIQLARQAGTNFSATLTAGLAQGKTFSTVCAGAKVKPVRMPAISLAVRALPEVEERVSLPQFKQIAFTTPVGKTSDFVPTRDGGLILQVVSRLPMDEAKLKTELPAYLNFVRQNRQGEVFNDWFRKQMELGYLQIPRSQQAQQ
jgi:parvulin-like peptidyl-prolyl isomerase